MKNWDPSDNVRTVQIDVVGEVTGRQYVGELQLRVALTQRQHVERSSIYRAILGGAPGEPDDWARSVALLSADLRVRTVGKLPACLEDSDWLLDLIDRTPIWQIDDLVSNLTRDYNQRLSEAARKAQEQLKKSLEAEKQAEKQDQKG